MAFPPRDSMYPRSQVIEAASRSVPVDDRVLLSGASGWFGRTTLAILLATHGPEWVQGHVLATARSRRLIPLLGFGDWQVSTRGEDEVARFAPTTVINCAFPTPGRLQEMGRDSFIATARHATAGLLASAGLSSVRRIVNFSSGASVPSPRFPADIQQNPYGYLKAEEDGLLQSLAASSALRCQTIRVWAATGPQVPVASQYAFSDLVRQAAHGGPVRVQSAARVIRCFTSVEDLICGGLLLTSSSPPGEPRPAIDSGGEVIELHALAERIADAAGCEVLHHAVDPTAVSDTYLPDDPGGFARECLRVGFTPASLDEQIAAALATASFWSS